MACRRTLAKPYPLPPMPPFPIFRITESRPFSHLGVDYMGPLAFKNSNSQVGKAWMCLITCLATRADSFIHILRRFISCRGLPQFILSNNGSQFKLDYCTLKSIEWKFITELAP
uniref:Integrase catalytic domain-containing protein n=1 Tax=Heterorhabditis bacteriophora TaxID=37862 RepID=A0A1I7XIC6_HETBA